MTSHKINNDFLEGSIAYAMKGSKSEQLVTLHTHAPLPTYQPTKYYLCGVESTDWPLTTFVLFLKFTTHIKGGCGVSECTRIETFKRRAGLGYR